MKLVIQRVTSASVHVEGKEISRIRQGLVILLGLCEGDDEKLAERLAQKACKLRLWDARDGSKSWASSVLDNGFDVLVVSQFTLFATFKGLKPNFNRALPGSEAEAIYESFVGSCRELLGDSHVGTGAFGEMMQLELCNDGPVTVELETPRSAVRGTRHRRTQRRRRPFCLAGAGFFLGRRLLCKAPQVERLGAAWPRFIPPSSGSYLQPRPCNQRFTALPALSAALEA